MPCAVLDMRRGLAESRSGHDTAKQNDAYASRPQIDSNKLPFPDSQMSIHLYLTQSLGYSIPDIPHLLSEYPSSILLIESLKTYNLPCMQSV